MKQIAHLRAAFAWLAILVAMTTLRTALHVLPAEDPTRRTWLPLAQLPPFRWRNMGQVVTATAQATPGDYDALRRDALPAPAAAA